MSRRPRARWFAIALLVLSSVVTGCRGSAFDELHWDRLEFGIEQRVLSIELPRGYFGSQYYHQSWSAEPDKVETWLRTRGFTILAERSFDWVRAPAVTISVKVNRPSVLDASSFRSDETLQERELRIWKHSELECLQGRRCGHRLTQDPVAVDLHGAEWVTSRLRYDNYRTMRYLKRFDGIGDLRIDFEVEESWIADPSKRALLEGARDRILASVTVEPRL